MTKRKNSKRKKKPNISAGKHLAAHLNSGETPHARRMRAAARKRKAVARKIVRIPIYTANVDELRAAGFPRLRRIGSVTLFHWPAKVIAAGYASTARPRHTVRMESGEFPRRLLRAWENLRKSDAKARIALVEIRAFHAHLAWRRGANERIIALLPNGLDLKAGKPYRRSEVEQRLADQKDRSTTADSSLMQTDRRPGT